MITIYGLYHNDRCIYVGQTGCLEHRMESHRPTFRRLIGAVPEARVIRRARKQNALKAERLEIRRFKQLGQAEFNGVSLSGTTPIYVSKDLHAQLKELAARKRIKLHELCEIKLKTLFKSATANGAAK